MLDFDRFRVLSFDCYGTLVDWETGLLEQLRRVLSRRRLARPDEELLELYARLEAAAERGPYQDYRTVLCTVLGEVGARYDFRPSLSELASFAESVPDWPLFPDTAAALGELRRRYRLAIVSNIDDDLIAATAERLGVPFDWVVTAQQARSYKPALHNFRLALERIGEPADRVLHVAQSLYHDIAPARELGLATVWVNRRGGRPGSGATPPAQAEPDLEVPDLRALADRVKLIG